jgi:hypothetical protein
MADTDKFVNILIVLRKSPNEVRTVVPTDGAHFVTKSVAIRPIWVLPVYHLSTMTRLNVQTHVH